MKRTGFLTPGDAEAAYYRAFEQGDARAMADVWASDPSIECIHPMGERLRGADVLRYWEKMFDKGGPVAFHLADRQQVEEGNLAVHVVMENILFQDRKEAPLRILATNVYRRDDNGWRMILHHASPAPFEQGGQQAANGAIH